MATTRDSAFYTSQATNKYLQQPTYNYRQRAICIPFEFTVVSVAATGDIYNLGVVKAYEKVVNLYVTTSGLGISAAGGRTLIIGDAGNTSRLLASTDIDLVNQSGVLAHAGNGWVPTADTIFYATIGGVPTVGGTCKGAVWVLPALS